MRPKLSGQFMENIFRGKYKGKAKVDGLTIKRRGDEWFVALVDADFVELQEYGPIRLLDGETVTISGLTDLYVRLVAD